MKAIRFNAPGDPDQVLYTDNVDVPVPGRGEVLVRMLAAPVNPSDLMYVRGHYTVPAQCPATPGFEGVGIVEASGGGLRGWLFRGKRVVVLNRAGGNWAERTVVPAHQVIPVSSKLSVEQCATFFVNPATAWVMTQDVLRIPKGAWLVQSAAGSALGRMIIRLGTVQGFRTLNLVRRSEVAEDLKRAGADETIVFRDGDDESTLLQQIQTVVGPDGVRFAVDAVGGQTGSALVRSLGAYGRMLAYGTLSGEPLSFSPRSLMTVGSQLEGFWLGRFMEQASLPYKLKLVKRLTSLIQSGVLSSEISATFPLGQIQDAVRSAEDSTVRGKSLLRMAD
jgi:NADPH2:quinone reductase